MKAIKDTRCKILTGLTQGTIKVLSDPDARPEGPWQAHLPQNLLSTGGGNTMNTPLDSGHWIDKSCQDNKRISASYEAYPIGSEGFPGAIQLAGKENRKK